MPNPKRLSLSRSNLQKLTRNKPLFLCLDYDGTLTPIVKRPSQAKLASSVRKLVSRINRHRKVTTAVISGREMGQVRQLVKIPSLIYVGNHGLQIRMNQTTWIHPKARRAKKQIQSIKRLLKRKLKGIPGLLIEDKSLVLGIHYRLVNPKQVDGIFRTFKAIVRPFLKKGAIKLGYGKKVWEIRPNISWNKGKAILHLLQARKAHKMSIIAYLGDDLTDETAFKVIGKKGLTIVVGKKSGTLARYTVSSPKAVHKFLKQIDSIYDQ